MEGNLFPLLTPSAKCAEQSLCNGRASVRLPVCLSHRSTAATEAGGFAAERSPVSRRYRSTAAGAMQQVPALRSECGQCHVDSRRRS